MRTGPLWILLITLFLAPRAGLAYDAFDLINEGDPNLEDTTVCGNESNHCKKVSCLELCLAEGEDPMDCPAVCILQARRGSPTKRYDLNLAVTQTEATATSKQLCQIGAN